MRTGPGKIAAGITGLCIDRKSTIKQALTRMDRLRRGIILVVDRSHRLVGTITDGDIRRCVLARMNLDLPVSAILARKSGEFRRPITARAGAPRETYLATLKKHRVLHLPLVVAAAARGSDEDYPIQRLRTNTPALWLVDQEASAGL